MNKFFTVLSLVLLIACNPPSNKENTSQKAAKTKPLSEIKVPVYAWMGGPNNATDQEIKANFTDLKNKGLIGLMYNGGHDPKTYQRVGRIAKEAGLEFHTWIPSLIQGKNPKLDPDLYAINGLGESAFTKPAYADHYKFLCPNREEVYQFLADLYGSIADLPEVDGIHLDYIRYPDVILGEGLWAKYDLVMDREYPQFDYCYCDHCVNGFKENTGIDIKSVDDPSQVEEWDQYRYDLITNIVTRLADMVHDKGKEINSAVFPGPNSIARKIVRQEWDKWNLDAFYPMNYNDFYLKGTKWVGEVTQEGVNAINNRNPSRAHDSKPLYSGLFICPKPESKSDEPDPEGHGLIPEELEDAIRESMENGAAGVCLFTPGRMTDEHWKVFETAIRKDFTKK